MEALVGLALRIPPPKARKDCGRPQRGGRLRVCDVLACVACVLNAILSPWNSVQRGISCSWEAVRPSTASTTFGREALSPASSLAFVCVCPIGLLLLAALLLQELPFARPFCLVVARCAVFAGCVCPIGLLFLAALLLQEPPFARPSGLLLLASLLLQEPPCAPLACCCSLHWCC